MIRLNHFIFTPNSRKILFFSFLLAYYYLVAYLIVKNFELAFFISLLPFSFLFSKKESVYFVIIYVFTVGFFSRYLNVLPEKSLWLTDMALAVLFLTNFSVRRIAKHKSDLIFLALFLFSSFLSVVLNEKLSLQTFVGMRRSLYPFIFLIVLALTIRSKNDWNELLKYLFIVVMIQPLFCFLEYFAVIFMKQTLSPIMYENYVPSLMDAASGTFGRGNAGVLSIFLLMYLVYLIFHDKYYRQSRNNIKYLYIMSPLLITFSGGALFMLPFVVIMIIFLYQQNISKKIFLYIPGAILAVYLVFNVATYFAYRTQAKLSTLNQFEYVKRNLSFNRLTTSHKGFVNRFGAIQIASDIAISSKGGILFGLGPGMFSKSVLAGTSLIAGKAIAFYKHITSSNFFVRGIAEYGLFGVAIIISYILHLLYVSFKKGTSLEIYKGIFGVLLIFLISSAYIEGWMNRQLGTFIAIIAFEIKFIGTNEKKIS